MLVDRALPAPKIPRRERHRIYAHDHLSTLEWLPTLAWEPPPALFAFGEAWASSMAHRRVSRNSLARPAAGSPGGAWRLRLAGFLSLGATRNVTRTRRSPGNRVLHLARRPTQRRVFCRRCDTKRDTDPVEPWESSAPPGPEPNPTARFLSQVRHETRHGPGGALGIESSA